MAEFQTFWLKVGQFLKVEGGKFSAQDDEKFCQPEDKVKASSTEVDMSMPVAWRGASPFNRRRQSSRVAGSRRRPSNSR